MNQEKKSDFFDDYQIQVTRQMCKILRILFFAIPAVWAGTVAGLFFAEHIPVLISVGFVVCYLPSLLLKLKVSENVVKYIAVISVSLMINFMFISNTKIQITFLLMPILATMYFDRKFILRMSVLNFLFIIGALVIVNPRQGEIYAQAGLINSAGDYLIERISSYSLELVVMMIVLVSVAGFARRLMDKLVEAEKEKRKVEIAEASNKAKSEFLAAMSHEIRTPMNAIIGITQIQMQKDNLPGDYATALNKIYSSGSSLLGIINDILDMSKIESGKFEITSAEYDVPSFINDAVQLNVVRIGSKEIEFLLDIDENLPSRLIGDELRLRQILNNLLSNSIKYTESGHVKLSISHSVAEGKEITLRFAVEDTGQGMKAEDQERLFSEYMRFNAEANRSTEGTGLGLNITRKLVEMMGGTIKVQSEYGKGSTFFVEVKQQAVEGYAAGFAPIGSELAEKIRNFTFSGDRQVSKLQITRYPMPYGKVLVVDDVETNLYVAEGLLAPYKLGVETVDSAFAAIDKIESGKIYDVIFMDHFMPKMDGIQATQKLRGLGYTGVIVALTANAMAGNDEMFRQNGFDGFISKPIDIRQLDAVLNKYVRRKYPEELTNEKLKMKNEELTNEELKMKNEKWEKDTAYSSPLSISGVDVAKGIAMTGGMQERYRQVLVLFCRDAEKRMPFLQAVPDVGNLSMFVTQVHALKSASASIGAAEVSALAEELEAAGRAADMALIQEKLSGFTEHLKLLVENIGSFLEQEKNEELTNEKLKMKNEEVKMKNEENSSNSLHTAHCSLLSDLSTALKSRNASEINRIMEELEQEPLDAKTKEILERISDAVLMGEFESALRIIEGLFAKTTTGRDPND